MNCSATNASSGVGLVPFFPGRVALQNSATKSRVTARRPFVDLCGVQHQLTAHLVCCFAAALLEQCTVNYPANRHAQRAMHGCISVHLFTYSP